MSNENRVYLNAMGMLNALGDSHESILTNLTQGVSPGMGPIKSPICEKDYFFGRVESALPKISTEHSEL